MPVTVFIRVDTVAISTQHITLCHFSPKAMQSDLWVLADVKKFFAADVVKV
jgi:hypothetical protein